MSTTKTKKLLAKFFFYALVAVILFFLVRNLLANWQQVKDWQFSFNYFYLLLASLLLGVSLGGSSLAWHKILQTLEPEHRISRFQALKIYIYAEFGRYAPGKVWAIAGKIYLGHKEGMAKKKLLVSSFLDAALSLLAVLFIGVFFLLFLLGDMAPSLYIVPALAMIGGFTMVHPKIFYPLFNLVLKKTKRGEIPEQEFLPYSRIIKIFAYYLVIAVMRGLGFFFLVKSLVASLPFVNLPGLIGAYSTAGALGVMALFAPSGLGVREGTLSMILGHYFPLSIAIYISFLARLWHTAVELALLGGIFLTDKLKRTSSI